MATPGPEPQPVGKTDGTSAKGALQPQADPVRPGRGPAWPIPSVPDHELLRCIGRGAYGAVWLARNVMGTFRAVKIVHREDFVRDRPFTREYEGLLKFEPVSRSHPNLMQILHVGRREDHFYYVTELADDVQEMPNAEGTPRNAAAGSPSPLHSPSGDGDSGWSSYAPHTLQADLEGRGRLPVRECLSLATALAAALKHLHDHGLVHRDVKPSNVIFVHGVPKLADIGLVATVGDSRSIVGTEGYLPPEGPGSPQADLYALGILLYEVSTGMNRQDYPCLPQDLRERVDAAELLEFNEVLLRACAKDPDRRYHRADELVADLVLLERGASVKRLRRLERHQALLKRIGIAALAIGLVTSAAWWQSWRAHRIVRRNLAQYHLDKGTQHMVQGDYAAALPWLVGALELDAGDPIREGAHRVRIASVLGRCPLPVAHFSAPESRVLAADINPQGTVVATAHEDGEVRLWDARSGERRQPQLHHDFPVVRCDFLPSGDQMLTASLGQEVHLWDLASPESKPLTFDQVVGFGSDGYSVGVSDSFGRSETLDPQGRPNRSEGRFRFMPIDPLTENVTLGLKLVGQGDSLTVRYEVRRTAPDDGVLYEDEVRESPGAGPFASGQDDPSARLGGRVFLALENKSVGDESGESGEVIWDSVRIRRYPSGEPPPPWRVLDDFSRGQLTNWVHAAPPGSQSTCRVANGQLILSCGNLPQHYLTWPGVLRQELFEVSGDHTFEVEADLVSVRAAHPQVSLGLYHPRLAPFAGGSRPFRLDDRWLVLNGWDWTIRIWDLEDERFATMRNDGRTVPLELPLERPTFDLGISPDAKYLAHVAKYFAHVRGQDPVASLWELGSGQEITGGELARLEASGVRFSPDNRFLAVSHDDGLELFRNGDWQSAHSLRKGESLAQPRFSPRGSRLAAVRDAREVLIWDLSNLAESPMAFADEFDVDRIVFSPDGRYLACSAGDGTVRVWDVIRGQPFGPPLPGALVGFSADGTGLICFADRSGEHGVWLWDLSRIVDNTLPVPPLLQEQPLATSRNRTMTAEIVGRGIVLTTPTGRYSLTAPARVPWLRLGFSPDDQHLIAESTDARAWIWNVSTRTLSGPPRPLQFDAALAHHGLPDLPVDDWERSTLSEMAAVLAGERPDGTGGMTPVDEAERVRLFGELQRRHPQGRNGQDANLARWHREHAHAAERAMDWDAAVFHWDQALRMKSEARNAKPETRSGRAPSEAPAGNGEITSSEYAIHNPQSTIPLGSRQTYARQAAEVVRQAMLEGKSRWSVPLPRPPWATPGMLNLSAFYTLGLGEHPGENASGASFRQLPAGVHHNLGGVGFDVRGILRLNPTHPVTIPVDRMCQRIHFLQAANRVVAGTVWRERAGRYQVTYADGQKIEVLLWNPEDVPPYSPNGFFARSATNWTGTLPEIHCTLAWSGCSAEVERHPEPLFLTRTTWELPESRRAQVVQTLELQAESSGSTPLIFAITVE